VGAKYESAAPKCHLSPEEALRERVEVLVLWIGEILQKGLMKDPELILVPCNGS